MVWCPWLWPWASMTTRSSNWEGGIVTPIKYMWTACRLGCSHSLHACIGLSHMVSLSSLCLSTSLLLWLEHSPTWGHKRADMTTIHLLFTNMDESIDERTPPVYALYAQGHMITCVAHSCIRKFEAPHGLKLHMGLKTWIT